MSFIKGKAFILAIIVISIITSVLLVLQKNNTDTKQLPISISDTGVSNKSSFNTLTDNSILSEKDQYKISDLFIIQNALYSYTTSKKSKYPSNLLNLKGTSYGKLPYNDPDGKPYTYTVQVDGSDYILSTELDNGEIYSVKGSTYKNIDAKDVNRMSDLVSISSALNGYFIENKQYPNSLIDLIPAGWGIRVNNGPEIIPTDPVTKEEYKYLIFNDKKDYALSSKLDIGISYILRSGMYEQN